MVAEFHTSPSSEGKVGEQGEPGGVAVRPKSMKFHG